MGSTEGLQRGLQVEDTGEPIRVPVGKETLGRMFNVLGEPIDNQGPIPEGVAYHPIHVKSLIQEPACGQHALHNWY